MIYYHIEFGELLSYYLIDLQEINDFIEQSIKFVGNEVLWIIGCKLSMD